MHYLSGWLNGKSFRLFLFRWRYSWSWTLVSCTFARHCCWFCDLRVQLLRPITLICSSTESTHLISGVYFRILPSDLWDLACCKDLAPAFYTGWPIHIKLNYLWLLIRFIRFTIKPCSQYRPNISLTSSIIPISNFRRIFSSCVARGQHSLT